MRPITPHGRALRDATVGATSAALGPPVIGVCEDDDELRGILRDALRREGIAVRPTVSGTEAV
jgi:two-component system OmpR family response regulator